MLSHVQFIASPWTVALQAPLSIGFSRQEPWSGFPFPPPGDLSNPEIKPMSLVTPALTEKSFRQINTHLLYSLKILPWNGKYNNNNS